MKEKDRIGRIYQDYGRSGLYRKRWGAGPGNVYLLDGRWEATARHLDRLFPRR